MTQAHTSLQSPGAFSFGKAGILLIILISGFFLVQCGTTSENRTDPGSSHNYRVGYPEVMARALGFYEDDTPVIDLTITLPKRALIFRNIEGERKTDVRIVSYFSKKGTEGDTETVQRIHDEFTVVDKRRSGGAENFIYNRSVRLEPGEYQITIQVTDKSSGNTTPTQLIVQIPDPESEGTVVSDIKVDALSNGDIKNISSYTIQGRADSLKFSFYVDRFNADQTDELIMNLIRFRSDDEPPRAMSALPLTTGSLAYRGIDYSDTTLVQQQTRTFDDETGPVLIEYIIPRPRQGVYRFEVRLDESLGEDVSPSKFRDFSLMSPNYPEIGTPEELAAPLYYLMSPREFRKLNTINDPDSLKRAIDTFWLENIRDRNKARDVIEMYYNRVEEANRLFSTFKEGWKTDMGMVYILFGPPVSVENTIDSHIWYYGFNQMDPRMIFRFDRARVTGTSFPFSHYVLVRNRFYQSIEFERINDWLTGAVLTRRN